MSIDAFRATNYSRAEIEFEDYLQKRALLEQHGPDAKAVAVSAAGSFLLSAGFSYMVSSVPTIAICNGLVAALATVTEAVVRPLFRSSFIARDFPNGEGVLRRSVALFASSLLIGTLARVDQVSVFTSYLLSLVAQKVGQGQSLEDRGKPLVFWAA